MKEIEKVLNGLIEEIRNNEDLFNLRDILERIDEKIAFKLVMTSFDENIVYENILTIDPESEYFGPAMKRFREDFPERYEELKKREFRIRELLRS